MKKKHVLLGLNALALLAGGFFIAKANTKFFGTALYYTLGNSICRTITASPSIFQTGAGPGMIFVTANGSNLPNSHIYKNVDNGVCLTKIVGGVRLQN